jgi:uncharacterized membrane protein
MQMLHQSVTYKKMNTIQSVLLSVLFIFRSILHARRRGEVNQKRQPTAH